MATVYRPEPAMVRRCLLAMREARSLTHFDPLPATDDSDEAMVRAVLVEAVAYMMERRPKRSAKDEEALRMGGDR